MKNTKKRKPTKARGKSKKTQRRVTRRGSSMCPLDNIKTLI